MQEKIYKDEATQSEAFLSVRVPEVFDKVSGDIALHDKLFAKPADAKPHEEKNRNFVRALLKLRQEHVNNQDGQSKPFWLDRYVRGLFLDYYRIDRDILELRALGHDPSYSQTVPSPISLSEALTILAAKRAYSELRQAGQDYDLSTAIHGMGAFIKYSLYVYQIKRSTWLHQKVHLDAIQVPNNPQKIEAIIRIMLESERTKQAPHAASITPISPPA